MSSSFLFGFPLTRNPIKINKNPTTVYQDIGSALSPTICFQLNTNAANGAAKVPNTCVKSIVFDNKHCI